MIEDAKALVKKFKRRGVIIFGLDTNSIDYATYGNSKDTCLWYGAMAYHLREEAIKWVEENRKLTKQQFKEKYIKLINPLMVKNKKDRVC